MKPWRFPKVSLVMVSHTQNGFYLFNFESQNVNEGAAAES
jgi:hypothetical protein